MNKTKLNWTKLWYLRRQLAAKTSLTKYILFLFGYVHTNPDIFKPHTVLNESAFNSFTRNEWIRKPKTKIENMRFQKCPGLCVQGFYMIPIWKTPQHLTERLTWTPSSHTVIFEIFFVHTSTIRETWKFTTWRKLNAHKVTLSNKVRKILQNVLGKLNGTKVKWILLSWHMFPLL